MSQTWYSDQPPEPEQRVGALGWALVLVRGLPLAVLVFGGLIILLVIRLFEWPVFGQHRPVTPYITQFVCRNAFRLMGMRFRTTGALMKQRGAVVANHSSWLDIFALNARKRIYFVSKAEVASWPGIGWLARATGTVFIERDRKQARVHADMIQQRLQVGHKLLFFPEGSSTDGTVVIPFKTTLFEAFFADATRKETFIQPVSVVYIAPPGQPDRFYGWWGDMDFGSNLVKVLAAFPQGRAELMYHAPVRVSDFADRKALAAHCVAVVRQGHDQLSGRENTPQ